MKTVILAGGYGTRIRDVSESIPKPMIPVGHRPILWHIMKGYAHHDLKDFIICLGYKSEEIKNYFLNYKMYQSDLTLDMSSGQVKYHNEESLDDWKVTFVQTGLDSGTGTRLQRIQKYIEGEEYFCLTYGDGVGDIDIKKLIDFHKSHGKIVTVTGVHPPGRFGDLDIDGNQVVGFNEKPQTHEGHISAGYFVCSKKFFDYLPEGDPSLMFENDPFKELASDGQMMVYKHDGFWMPMDTSRDYNYLNTLWKQGSAPWKVWS